MKRKWLSVLLVFSMTAGTAAPALAAETAAGTNDFISAVEEAYASPEIEYRPQVRWWMAQGSHTDETLIEDVDTLKELGFGAIECLAMSDDTVTPASRYSWGSPEWNADMQLLLKEATENDMGISFTSGTNWGNANLPDTFTYDGQPFDADNSAAMQVLSYGQMNLAPGESIQGAIPEAGVAPAVEVDVSERVKYFVGVVAARVVSWEGDVPTLSADTIDLTDQVVETEDGYTLEWTNESDSDYLILSFWQHGAGATAGPSYSTNYTINYVDKLGADAVAQYWDENILTPEMQELIDENGKVEFYMDSLEIGQGTCNGGTLWGFDFAETFEKNRGYSVIQYLPFLIYEHWMSWCSIKENRFNVAEEDQEKIDKVINDMYQTKTETYQENVLQPLTEWLHGHNISLRAEISYGQLFEISTPGKYVDGIETETLEFNASIDSYRNLSGSAHLYGKNLSCETGANSGGALYRNTLDFYNHYILEGFAAGVNRNVLHTFASIWAPSEEEAEWPGYTPNAHWSDRFGVRQPYSCLSEEWSSMVARYQKALNQGTPKVDLGILRIDYDMNGRIGEEGYLANSTLPTIRHNEGLYWRDFSLQEAGYTYDYFAPMNLEEEEIVYDAEEGLILPDGVGYKALLIYQDEMPLSSAQVILEWAKEGLPVILANDTEELAPNVNCTLTEDSFALKYEKAASKTPYNDGKDEELQQVIEELKSLPNVIELDPDEPGIKLGEGSSESKAPEALKSLGVLPRAAFVTENDNFITTMRESEDTTYLYVYNYAYDAEKQMSSLWGTERPAPDTEAYTTEISIEGMGIPYYFNANNGEVKKADTWHYEEGRTVVEVTLEPGEAAMIFLDRTAADEGVYAVSTTADHVVYDGDTLYVTAAESGTYETTLNDGSTVATEVNAPENISLDKWNLTLESWEPGELQTRTETRNADFAGEEYTTTEYTTTTEKRRIDVGETELVAWKDLAIENADQITGVGYYTTAVTLPKDWSADENGAYLAIGSINQGAAVVYVNDQKVEGIVDNCDPKVDISAYLQPGENELRVEVTASSLCNALQTGTYGASEEIVAAGAAVQDYGMTGETMLVTYSKVAL